MHVACLLNSTTCTMVFFGSSHSWIVLYNCSFGYHASHLAKNGCEASNIGNVPYPSKNVVNDVCPYNDGVVINSECYHDERCFMRIVPRV